MNPQSLAEDIANLTQQTAAANTALMRGDIVGRASPLENRYLALTQHAEDYTLMSPFGGEPTHGFDMSRRVEMGRFFKSGTFDQEVVATYATDDLVVLVTNERVCAEVGGLPKQDWSLRVTQVFRRGAIGWQLVHRHADPLANGISLQQAAALALGVTDAHRSAKST